MEERYMYQVNTIMPILGLSIGTIKVPTSQNLTKDDVLICLKKAPVFRRFSDGNKERVGIDNIDRLHRENYMTVEEYNEYLANKTNDIVEEKVEEPVVEESEPEADPIVEESAPVEEVVEEETVEEEEVFIPVPEEDTTVEENAIEEESTVVEEDNDVVANELFDSVIEDEVTEEEEISENNSNNNNNYFRNRKKKH